MTNEIKLRKFSDVVTSDPIIVNESIEGSNGILDLMVSATEIVSHKLRALGIQVKFKSETRLMPRGKALSKAILSFGETKELAEWSEFNETGKEIIGYSKRLEGITNISYDMQCEAATDVLVELIKFYVERNK